MEYLFGFVFLLIKIALQASVYATLARWLANGRRVALALGRASRGGRAFWQRSFVVAYAALFLFSCTYWGDHGLGDSARIPLGHGQAMTELNGTATYFEAAVPLKLTADNPAIDKFQVADDVLCGYAEDKSYFAYNLATAKQEVFADSLEYTAYAAPRGLPPISSFQSFWQHYRRYWGGWRFWLLA